MAVKLTDNIPQSYVFDYDNCIRMESSNNGKVIPGKWYYSFGKGESRLNATSELCAAIQENWPGKKGEVLITRRNAHHFEVEIKDYGALDNNGVPYPLAMKTWGEGKPYPEDVEFEILGLENGGGAPAANVPAVSIVERAEALRQDLPNADSDPPPVEEEAEEEADWAKQRVLRPESSSSRQATTADDVDAVDAQWIEKSNRMSSCLQMARQALQTSGLNADEVDVEVTQKLAVTLYIDSKGLAPLSMFWDE
jgi:hypothetical protein